MRHCHVFPLAGPIDPLCSLGCGLTRSQAEAGLTRAVLAHLAFVARGKAAQIGRGVSLANAVLDGMLIERGLARIVKHRDHTRSLALTAAGKRAIAASGKGQP